VSFVGAEEGAALTGQKGQIELVVREGLEAFLPMAGLFDAGACPRPPAPAIASPLWAASAAGLTAGPLVGVL
jgi:hypothetical protein